MRLLHSIRGVAGRLLSAYGALFLARGAAGGALVLAATLLDPAIGLMGLAAGLAAMGARSLLRLPALAGQVEVLNAIYVGLVLGAFHAPDARLLALAMVGGGLVVPLGTALGPWLRRAGDLPLLGAPFLIAVWTLLPTARALSIPLRVQAPAVLFPAWMSPGLNSALSTIGALFYVTNPLSGAVLLAAVLLASPVLALFAVAGGGLAWGLVTALGVPAGSALPVLAAFNGALTALVLSTNTTASARSLAVVAGGVTTSATFSAALLWVFWPLGLPPLSAPFLLSVWLVRAALRAEHGALWSRFWLPVPARPEESLSRQRLERMRGVDSTSIALRPPFVAAMDVSQAMDGPLTHRGPWRYALDFIRTEEGRSARGDGDRLGDFHSFDLPLVSPAWGTVLSCRSDVPDNQPGAINLQDNWGNHVLIGMSGGACALLAHLRQGSVAVAPGQWLAPGTPIGRCGNSGRSTQPHLHLHVQDGSWLGAPTRPFHLAGYVRRDGRFVLDGTPSAGEVLEHPAPSAGLSGALGLAAGREWRFAIEDGPWMLSVQLGLLGETVLVSDRGARMQACKTDLLFAMYQRSGSTDRVLDAFALAFGLTPLTDRCHTWRDAPVVDLLALTPWQRLRVALRHPLGCNLESRYERRWDARSALWVQWGEHRLPAIGGGIVAETVGHLSETDGPVGFRLSLDGRRDIRAGLAGFGNRGDHGIPAWSVDVARQPATFHPAP
jgi:urea transporter